MFYLKYNGYKFDLNGNDEKEGDNDEDDPKFSNEVLFQNMDYQEYRSCASQYYTDNHDVTKQDKEENSESLNGKMVVLSGPPVNF